MTRLSYGRELLCAVSVPFLVAGLQGSIAAVFVRNAYEGVVAAGTLNMAATLVAASPALTNISSPLWNRILRGRHRPRAMATILLLIMLAVAALSLSPMTPAGLVIAVAAVIATQTLWTGFISARSIAWESNYPRAVRGRITGRFAMVQVLTVALLGQVLGQALDLNADAFRLLLPVGCAVAFVAVRTWAFMPVRRHEHTIAVEKARRGDPLQPASSALAVLKADRPYAAFMGCQMLLGLGNLMVTAIMPVTLREGFNQGYAGGIWVANTLPLIMMPLTIPWWARLLDRGHVVRFRSIHSWVFACAITLLVLGFWLGSMPLVYAAALVQGAGFGGGVLAWNLGHMDFAPPGRAPDYLNVHILLTGIRGLAAPFLAERIYALFKHLLIDPDGSRGLAAAGLYAVCAALSLAGAVGFTVLGLSPRFSGTDRRDLQ